MHKQVAITLLPTLRLQWLSSIYVMRVMPRTTEQLRVTTLAPSVPPRPPVPNFRWDILIHATGCNLVTSVTKFVWPWQWKASWSVSVDQWAEIAVYCDFRF